MKLFFVLLCNAFFYTSTAIAMNLSDHIDSQQKQMDNNIQSEIVIAPKLSTDLDDKSKRVITVRIYTEEDCD